MYLEVDAFPELTLVHVPTLDRCVAPRAAPGRWVFTDLRHPMITIADDGIPRYPGWQVSTDVTQAPLG